MIQKLTVIGAGVMGHGIAQVLALAGISVQLYDLKMDVLKKARSSISKSLDLFMKNGFISLKEKEQVLERIHITTHLEDSLVDSKFVIEAVPEILQLKWDLYKTLETICHKDVIIASNTSTIPLSTLIQQSEYPERFIITHFLNPAPLVPLVEVIRHESTSNNVVETTLAILKKIGKSPILLKKEISGFIANRLQAALLREALALVNDGIVDAYDMDRVIKEGPGFRWAFIGPIETADYGGLDTWKRVLDNLSSSLDKSQRAPEMINTLVSQENLGAKSGKGIYSYENISIEEKLAERDQYFLQLLKIKDSSKHTLKN